MNKEVYNEVINALMVNDHNGTWDEILDDAENDLECAIEILISALQQIIDEEDYDDGELAFYKHQLNKIKKSKESNYGY